MAQELQLRVDTSKYEARITMLERHIGRLEGLLAGYEELKNGVGEFLGNDDHVEDARRAADIGIKRCQKAINATQENIKAIQELLDKYYHVGENVSTIFEEAIASASGGLFD